MRVTKLPWNPFQPLTILFANDLFMWLTIAVVSSTIGEYGQLSLLFYYTSGSLGFSRQRTCPRSAAPPRAPCTNTLAWSSSLVLVSFPQSRPCWSC